MKYSKKFSALLSLCLFSSSSIISSAQELSQEVIDNYRYMGMSDEEIDKINEELKDKDDPNYVTETEQRFYIEKMGIKEEDMYNMLEEQRIKEESGYKYNKYSFRTHGTYPTEKGIILVTKDKVAGVIPLGHAAIILNNKEVVEAHPDQGVHTGRNNWNSTRTTVYGLKVHKLSQSQRAEVATWCGRKRTLPYNWNFYDVNTRSKFYCSQLVWAGFKDLYNVDLNGGQYGQAIYPPEMIDSGYVYRIYIKGDGY